MQRGEKTEIIFTHHGRTIKKNVLVESVSKKGEDLVFDLHHDFNYLENETVTGFEQFTIYDSMGNVIAGRGYHKENASYDEQGKLVSVTLGDSKQFRILCEYEKDLLKNCNFGNRVSYSLEYDSDSRIAEYIVETVKGNSIEKIAHKFEYKTIDGNSVQANETVTDISGEQPLILEKYFYSKEPDRFVKKLLDSSDKEIYSEISIARDGVLFVEKKSNTSITREKRASKYYCKTEENLNGYYYLHEIITSDDNKIKLITEVYTNPNSTRTNKQNIYICDDEIFYTCKVLDVFNVSENCLI